MTKDKPKYRHYPVLHDDLPLRDDPISEFEAFIWVDREQHEFEDDDRDTVKRWLANMVAENPSSMHYGLWCNNTKRKGNAYYIFLQSPHEEVKQKDDC